MYFDSKPSNQLLLESNIFAYAAAVDHGIWLHAPGDDCPLRQDSDGFFVWQWPRVEGIKRTSEPMTQFLRK